MSIAAQFKRLGMKDSGIEWLGHIPTDWDVRKLKFVVKILKRIAGYEGPSVLSITQQGIKIKDIESGEGQLAQDYSGYQLVVRGDFAMNHMDLLTGYVDISCYDGVVSPDYRVFRNLCAGILDEYLLLIFQIGYAQKIFFRYGQGVSLLGRWRLPADHFNEFSIPIPPMDQQRKIVAFLKHKAENIDEAVRIKEEQIKLLRERRQILIQQAVTRGLNPNAPMKDSGIDWIGQIPAHWEVRSIRYAFRFRNSQRVPLSGSEREHMQGEYPYYGASGIIDYVNGYIFDKDLILIAEDGANLLSKSTPLAFVARGKYWVNNHAHILEPLFQGFEYWAEMLSAVDYTTYISGSAQPKLTRDRLGSVRVPVPPPDEREKIISLINQQSEKFRNAIAIKEDQIAALKEYKMSLINEAVTGKIRIV